MRRSRARATGAAQIEHTLTPLSAATGSEPTRLASPFAHEAPHPLAQRAAEALQRELAGHDCSADGKMFGVLVVAGPDGLGYLRAFSGMLGGRWDVAGFAPPLFDAVARDRIWPAGEAELAALALRQRALDERIAPLEARAAALAAERAVASEELRARHRANRAARHVARAAGAPRAPLDQASRADTAERRRFDAIYAPQRTTLVTEGNNLALVAEHAALASVGDELALVAEHAGPGDRLAALVAERAALAVLVAEHAALAALVAERAELAERRAARSRELLVQIYDTYRIPNARGEHRAMRELFAPDAPPGGSGDCAAPKLFAEAFRRGLRPLALAEFWWGAPPATGGRHHGLYYPACRGKCGVILPYMLAGLAVDDAPVFPATAVAADEPRVIFEDRWLMVVAKPCGLLSVPGRSGQLRDSVVTRLRRTEPALDVVHRLDLDTSGILLAAKDPATCALLQQQFARRLVDKRYVAWLDGEVAGERGTIELALRVDVDDRPRQIVDPIHGKHAVTEWRVVERRAGRTRVEFVPRTGRTHQLRVHAAHPLGLAAPIAGDRLYGRPTADRLLLHAESLAFEHPYTRARIALEVVAPF